MSAGKPEPDDETIAEIVRHLPSVDWEKVKRLARMTPAERVLVGMRMAEDERAAVREKLNLLYPQLSPSQLNMKVLVHFTPIRMPQSDPRHPDNY